jgi:hypothetical protein
MCWNSQLGHSSIAITENRFCTVMISWPCSADQTKYQVKQSIKQELPPPMCWNASHRLDHRTKDRISAFHLFRFDTAFDKRKDLFWWSQHQGSREKSHQNQTPWVSHNRVVTCCSFLFTKKSCRPTAFDSRSTVLPYLHLPSSFLSSWSASLQKRSRKSHNAICSW